MSELAYNPKMQFFDSNGAPLSGGKLHTYEAGTVTDLATYSDSDLSSANANPIILDSRGEATVWLQDKSYKFVLKDSNDVDIWTVDNINPQTNESRNVTSSATLTPADRYVEINNSAAATLTLPAGLSGLNYIIRRKASNNNTNGVTIATDGSETINGQSSINYRDANFTVGLWWNGTEWSTTFLSRDGCYFAATGSQSVGFEWGAVEADSTSGTLTITLPTAVGNEGKEFEVVKISSDFQAVVIDGNSSETINGSTTRSLYLQYESMRMRSNGANWYIVHHHIPSTQFSFTPSWSNLTVGNASVNTGAWWRTGGDMNIYAKLVAGSTTSPTGSVGFSIPQGFNFVSGITAEYLLGWGHVSMYDANAVRNYKGEAYTSGSNLLYFLAYTHSLSATYVTGQSSWNATTPFTTATGDIFVFRAKVPIEEWRE